MLFVMVFGVGNCGRCRCCDFFFQILKCCLEGLQFWVL